MALACCFNWNLLARRPKSLIDRVSHMADGVEFAEVTVIVTTLELAEFLQGLSASGGFDCIRFSDPGTGH